MLSWCMISIRTFDILSLIIAYIYYYFVNHSIGFVIYLNQHW